ncbi:MAG: hypothetical protein ACR2PY_01260 [Salinispira sp.]
MYKNTFPDQNLPPGDEVSEASHWAIKFGEITLPEPERDIIKTCNYYLEDLLIFMFHVYIHALCSADYVTSAKIISYMYRFSDPYIPGICAEAGWDGDDYLDEIDMLD